MTSEVPSPSGRGEGESGVFSEESIVIRRVYIAGTGSYLPAGVVTNDDLADTLGLTSAGIEKMTGIKSRRRASPEESTSDLATHAAISALHASGVAAEDLDLIVLATTSADMPFPATACLVQKNIGAKRAFAFDINASCSGFLYALNIAETFIKNGAVDTALVIASEVKSRFVNPADRETAILFGDGAGAVLLRHADGNSDRGVTRTRLHADGKNGMWIHLPAGGSKVPATGASLAQGLHTMRMDGTRVYRAAIKTLVEMVKEIIKECGLRIDDIDSFIFHQANLRIINQVIERTGIPGEKVPLSLTHIGNTSSASIPITLDQAVREGRIKEGDTILLASFGGGLTWGAAIVRW